MRVCEKPGCERAHYGRGMCQRHYKLEWEAKRREARPPKPVVPPLQCDVEDCSKMATARGWCDVHYTRWRKHGHPEALMINPWTDDEYEVLRRTKNLTARQVAAKLGRSVSSVKNARHQIRTDEGISFEKEHLDPSFVGGRRLLAKSCLGCGLLLEAKWFVLRKHDGCRSRVYQSRCTRCTSQSPEYRKSQQKYQDSVGKGKYAEWNAAAHKRRQELTRDRADRHGFPWLDSDHETLRDTSLSVFEKAIRLGRTYNAVNSACSRNGYTSRVGKGDPVQGAWHIDNPNEMEQAS